ncbi:MAG: hypothetical protein LQ339_000890 [Xanthoria mediterranea]|nr:MAG: hypothetical protein LQ339_000890 [Xanthoria mediterranea]
MTSSSEPPIPDSPTAANTSIPLPLSASILLTALPQDATSALDRATAAATADVPEKVTIRLQPIGSAPQLRQKVFKISAKNRFETVVSFLRNRLFKKGEAGGDGEREGEGAGHVFCYVNSVFAPGLDEGVGALWRCFKTDDQLIVAYSTTPAFG